MPAKPNYEALFRASAYPYMLLNPQLNIIDVNDAHLAVTGLAASHAVGRPVFEAFPENADDPVSTNVALARASMQHALATREPDAMPFDTAQLSGLVADWALSGTAAQLSMTLGTVYDIATCGRATAARFQGSTTAS